MLCQTAVVYSRRVGGTVHRFGHEGVLYRQSFVMYDHETQSLWIHATGEAVTGPCKGQVLTFLPATVTTWGRWMALHPGTTVLPGARAKGGMGDFRLGREPDRYGLSVGQGAAPKLYPFAALREARVANEELDGRPIVVVLDLAAGVAKAYERGARTFRWRDGALVDGDGTAFDPLSGAAVGGGARLVPVPGTIWLVERWRSFHPRGPVHGEAR